MKSHSEKIGVNLYCIRNAKGNYWNNHWGWMRLYDETEELEYSVFTTQEKEQFNLPIGKRVRWEKI